MKDLAKLNMNVNMGCNCKNLSNISDLRVWLTVGCTVGCFLEKDLLKSK